MTLIGTITRRAWQGFTAGMILGGASLSASWADTGATPDWHTLAGDEQRTSWTSEQVPNAALLASRRDITIYPLWSKPIAPYIPHKVQVIAANGMIYVSTSKGLYAFDAATGVKRWVYATEMPLGHSPTVIGSVAYVGCLDHKLHAIDASVGGGTRISTSPEAGGGFMTNPLVVNGVVYAGNRDGVFYAWDPSNPGVWKWTYNAGAPILFSAAYDPDHAAIYFAADNNRAYALNENGTERHAPVQLAGAGFHSYWPVVYKDAVSSNVYVMFAGSHNYRDNVSPGPDNGVLKNLEHLDRELFNGANTYSDTGPQCGAMIGYRANGTEWMDASVRDPRSAMSVMDYFGAKPYRRTFFVLDGATGNEASFTAPFIWLGSQSGNRYPPVYNPNLAVTYQVAGSFYRNYIDCAQILGWKVGTSQLNTPSAQVHIVDEPVYYAMGGSIVYWVQHQETCGGLFSTSAPNTTRVWDNAYDSACSAVNQPNYDYASDLQMWGYGPNVNDYLLALFPNYDRAMTDWFYGGANGTYGRNGDGNPPIPYQGRVYFIKGNALMAWDTTVRSAAPAAPAPEPEVVVHDYTPTYSQAALQQKLEAEVTKTIAGHLRPGYMSSGHLDAELKKYVGDYFHDYFSNPADTIYTLARAIPYLTDGTLISQTQAFMQSEMSNYAPYSYTHIGYKNGTAREFFDLPPDVVADCANFDKGVTSWEFLGWGLGGSGGTGFPPHIFYALWKYALALGFNTAQANTLFNASKSRLARNLPNNSATEFWRHPYVLNSYIAGYEGYYALSVMAGQPDAVIQAQINVLKQLRATTFTTDSYWGKGAADDNGYGRALDPSQNFLFLSHELGQYLYDNPDALSPAPLGKVQAAVDEYTHNTPYWFVERYEDSINEGEFAPLYDALLLQAKALILKEPQAELVKYLDVPMFAKGDLIYMQNLLAVLEAGSPVPTRTVTPVLSPTPSPTVTPTRTATPIVSPTPTATATPTRTATPIVSPTPTATPTRTRTPTRTPTPVRTATPTATASPTTTPTPTATPRTAPEQASTRFLSPSLADGINDEVDFDPQVAELVVYNLQGQEVYQARGSGLTWRGRTTEGKVCPSGQYIAKLKRADGTVVYQPIVIVK
jgi:hypothetical protein